MSHGRHNKMMNAKPKNFKQSLFKLLKYLKPYHLLIVLVILCAIGATIFNIVGPRILGNATTLLANGIIDKYQGGSGIDFVNIAKILITLLIIYLTSCLLSFLQNWIMSKVTQSVTYQLRKDISQKINRLPLKYFDTKTHGEILSRVSNDVETISQSLNQVTTQMISAIVTIAGVLFMMIKINVVMTLMALIVIPLSGIITAMIIRKSQGYFKKQQAILGELNGNVEEIYSGHLVIKAFNKEKDVIDTFDTINEKLAQTALKAQFISSLTQPLTNLASNFAYICVCVLGGYYATRKIINIGDIQAFIQYVRNFNQPISQTAQIMNILQSTMAASERVFEFLEENEEVKETTNPVNIYDDNHNINIEGNVVFENVHFGYDPNKIIINNFSCYVKKGQQIAIVGPTGAGKTTLVKLLMRFYELNSGTIYIDDHDIKDFTRSDLRKLFGMVLQDAWLFSGTIMDNLRYGNLEASDEDVIKAAKSAHVDHFIRTLEDGYNTYINEESTNISQGQKQLLTIARAFLKDPKILILDEATSSVDTRTEIMIQKGMESLMQGRTTFVIAHRLSTIKNADMILVIKDGDIVEMGKHDELLAKNGFYAKLYNSQFEDCE
ncbi:MAG: ABC transporter ATP-binding protein [Erysipelotrichaceae bacterium]|nr:ABC transporter ATP-binding protein [Erysipelotrichaceae bacterium]